MHDLWQYVDPEKSLNPAEASTDKSGLKKDPSAPSPSYHERMTDSPGRANPKVRGMLVKGNEHCWMGNGKIHLSTPGPGNQRISICESLLPGQSNGLADVGDGMKTRASREDPAVSGGVLYAGQDVSSKVASVFDRVRSSAANASSSTPNSNPQSNDKANDQDDAFESLKRMDSQAEWERGDATARYVITSSLTGQLQRYATNHETAAELWQAVVSRCEKTLEKDALDKDPFLSAIRGKLR